MSSGWTNASHTYAFTWWPDHIDFAVDGTITGSKPPEGADRGFVDEGFERVWPVELGRAERRRGSEDVAGSLHVTSPGRARPRRDRPGTGAGRSCRARLATPPRRRRSPW
ncbi:family 16 glycosylhydrolase [Streptomyces sp. NBC_00638]|uniref:family 16 glycosylhydrolase n=1 Tax=unclassified Streptomyces TaxID=2593676 RepID=UPI00224E6ABA|nr:family 16 glycosylhydrolase [Streptomyces sp. NBC_00638]MCX5009084.1 family 16 glycosylhydrolase [Streptomyces sp. NBC_00638]